MRPDVREVDGRRDVAVAVELGDDGLDGLLAQVDGEHARTGRGEGTCDLAADAAAGAGHHHAPALEARCEVEAHQRSSL